MKGRKAIHIYAAGASMHDMNTHTYTHSRPLTAHHLCLLPVPPSLPLFLSFTHSQSLDSLPLILSSCLAGWIFNMRTAQHNTQCHTPPGVLTRDIYFIW